MNFLFKIRILIFNFIFPIHVPFDVPSVRQSIGILLDIYRTDKWHRQHEASACVSPNHPSMRKHDHKTYIRVVSNFIITQLIISTKY